MILGNSSNYEVKLRIFFLKLDNLRLIEKSSSNYEFLIKKSGKNTPKLNFR